MVLFNKTEHLLPDTSLKYVLFLSDSGIVYKEIEHGIIVFVVHFSTWYYLYRYRPDTLLRFVDKHTYGTLEIDLRECHIDSKQGWLTGEEYPDQSVIALLRKRVCP